MTDDSLRKTAHFCFIIPFAQALARIKLRNHDIGYARQEGCSSSPENDRLRGYCGRAAEDMGRERNWAKGKGCRQGGEIRGGASSKDFSV